MSELELWRLCDELTVAEAALLHLNKSPDLAARAERTIHAPEGYPALRTAILNALRRGDLKGKIVAHRDHFGQDDDPEAADPLFSRVDVASLREWFAVRGIRSGFFFPEASAREEYLDERHPRYAPKLAAAVRAWLATDGDLNGKSPKQAIEKWLQDNANGLGLINEDGSLNGTGIEQISKVANWKPGGGAPKTPGEG